MTRCSEAAALALSCLLTGPLHAQPAAPTPAGLWKTIDDATQQPKSLVRIVEQGGVYNGRVEQLLDPTAAADAVCTKCEGERHGQPVRGLQILDGVRQSERDAQLWDGGEILDPNNGKTYRVRLKPVDDGRRLEVRGYIGTPLIGRTQTWIRVD